MRLVKLFDEYDNIIVKGKSNRGRYDAYYKIERIKGKKITLEDLQRFVENLSKKFPSRHFYLKRIVKDEKTFYVVAQPSYARADDGTKVKVKGRIPIYIDLDKQEFYIPSSYLFQRRKLAHYIIMRTLGALGVAQSRYIGITGGRA